MRKKRDHEISANVVFAGEGDEEEEPWAAVSVLSGFE